MCVFITILKGKEKTSGVYIYIYMAMETISNQSLRFRAWKLDHYGRRQQVHIRTLLLQ
jgi:hypothetical protein